MQASPPGDGNGESNAAKRRRRGQTPAAATFALGAIAPTDDNTCPKYNVRPNMYMVVVTVHDDHKCSMVVCTSPTTAKAISDAVIHGSYVATQREMEIGRGSLRHVTSSASAFADVSYANAIRSDASPSPRGPWTPSATKTWRKSILSVTMRPYNKANTIPLDKDAALTLVRHMIDSVPAAVIHPLRKSTPRPPGDEDIYLEWLLCSVELGTKAGNAHLQMVLIVWTALIEAAVSALEMAMARRAAPGLTKRTRMLQIRNAKEKATTDAIKTRYLSQLVYDRSRAMEPAATCTSAACRAAAICASTRAASLAFAAR